MSTPGGPQPIPNPGSSAGKPGRTPEQIRRDIDAQRQDLGTSVEQLRNRVAELTDWRGQIREHQRELAIGAAVVGFAIGGMIALRRRR
jgi:hypothetical protein